MNATKKKTLLQRGWKTKEPMPVVYNERTPMEFFDFIVIDECHQSIYNLWKQVLDYFDAFQIGLTATPDNRTFGYFEKNIVSDYGYKKAVEDGVLVPYNVFEIETKITKEGSKISIGEYIDTREKLTRKKFWNQLDEDVEYSNKQLDDKVVNVNQITLIIQAVRDQLPYVSLIRSRELMVGSLKYLRCSSLPRAIAMPTTSSTSSAASLPKKISSAKRSPTAPAKDLKRKTLKQYCNNSGCLIIHA